MFVNNGTTLLVNSTADGNHATSSGGAIFVQGSGFLRVFNSTISNNDANSDQAFDGGVGGGIRNLTSDPVQIANSILSGNFEWVPDGISAFVEYYQECSGPVQSNGFNIVTADDGRCSMSGTVSAGLPLLLPPVYNGGFNRTRALPANSPAVGAGHPSGCVDNLGAPITTDQRGAVRPYGGSCDLGAFELGNLIFDDDFELGSTGRWSQTVPP